MKKAATKSLSNVLQSEKVPLNLTTLTRANPLIQRKTETRGVFLRETLQKFTDCSLIVSIFKLTKSH